MPQANLTRGNSITEDIGNQDRQEYHQAVRSVLRNQDLIYKEKEFYYYCTSKGMYIRNPGDPFFSLIGDINV